MPLSAGTLWAAPHASATILFATEAAGPANAAGIAPFNIVRLDTVAHTETVVLNQSTNIDSLFFDPAGRIIFSEQFANKVLAFELNTSTATTLAGQAQGLLTPENMALDPSGTSFLVSNIGKNTIFPDKPCWWRDWNVARGRLSKRPDLRQRRTAVCQRHGQWRASRGTD